MSVLVPAQGWSAAFLDVDTTPNYRLLGPFSPGCILERLVWRFTALRAAQTYFLTFGAVLTASNAADNGGWDSGTPVVQRSPTTLGQIPAARFQINTTHTFDVVMAIGVPVRSGSLYVLTRVEASSADERVDGFVTVFASAVMRVSDDAGLPSVPVVQAERGRG